MQRKLMLFMILAGGLVGCGEDASSEKTPLADGGSPDTLSYGGPQVDLGSSLQNRPDQGADSCEAQCSGRSCGPDGCGGFCGSCPDLHECSDQGECLETGCERYCAGKECGPDNCGGSCGQCSSKATCDNGTCVPKYPLCDDHLDCAADEFCLSDGTSLGECTPACDYFDPEGSCQSGSCNGIFVDKQAGEFWPSCSASGERGEGESCVFRTTFPYGTDCAPGLLCFLDGGCHLPCDAGHGCPKPGQECIAIEVEGLQPDFGVCYPPLGPCDPNPCFEPKRSVCTVVQGEAHCDCDPGYQLADGQCVETCYPSCAGRACGPDGCGGSCGSCAAGATCTEQGVCCVPECAGKACGPDGCGGSCGGCSADESCTAAGTCCAPACAGRECGPDGCGGSCGSCAANASCTAAGQCLCTPSCTGKECGSDGCGGSCGSCAGGATCSYGSCVTVPVISHLSVDSTVMRDVTTYGSVRVVDPDGLAGLQLKLAFSGPATMSTNISVSGLSSSSTAADVSFSFELPAQAPDGYYTLTVRAVDGDGNQSNSLSTGFSLY